MIKYKDMDPIKLQFWDSAGQERYRSLIPSYVKNANGIFLIYDISERSTFDNIPIWIDFIEKYSSKDTIIVLCGNKTDKEDLRKVTFEEGEKLANKKGMIFYEVSAKNNNNVLKMVFHAISQIPAFITFIGEERDNLIDDLIKENSEINNPSSDVEGEPNKVSIKQNSGGQINNEKPIKKKKCCL